MKAEELAVAQENCWRNIAISLVEVRHPDLGQNVKWPVLGN